MKVHAVLVVLRGNDGINMLPYIKGDACTDSLLGLQYTGV
jgi:hypothetical protein